MGENLTSAVQVKLADRMAVVQFRFFQVAAKSFFVTSNLSASHAILQLYTEIHCCSCLLDEIIIIVLLFVGQRKEVY